ncbi:hypothetical protein [Bacillus sp. JCM 19034]|uniref:hypothetical protein n=1 Tax=Bacillus sp. JCM 19034 TaxID=1481928 RepID=UPI000783EF94|nr:hypothetical protein [Bacillus sp. JCM 19034]
MKRSGFKGTALFLIVVLFIHLLLPFGAYANAEIEKVDIIVSYKDEVPDNPVLINYENEVVMNTLPIRAMTVPVNEIDRLEKDPNVVSVSIDQPLQLMVEETDLTVQNNTNDWNNELVKAFDAWMMVI